MTFAPPDPRPCRRLRQHGNSDFRSWACCAWWNARRQQGVPRWRKRPRRPRLFPCLPPATCGKNICCKPTRLLRECLPQAPAARFVESRQWCITRESVAKRIKSEIVVGRSSLVIAHRLRRQLRGSKHLTCSLLIAPTSRGQRAKTTGQRLTPMIQTLEWTDSGVRFIDQTKLPTEETYVTCRTYTQVADVIRNMVVRGAPAIGVAAAMGIALGVKTSKAENGGDLKQEFDQICDVMGKTRPTAVNLFWAIRRMRDKFEMLRVRPVAQIKQSLIEEAQRMHAEDIAANQAMGRHGATLMPASGGVLTHRNAGALATCGYGTALGVIRAAVEQGKKIHVFADETRPFLQGSRLTAWELMKDNIPTTVISDNMAGAMMSQGKIGAIVVGADRIAANGDVANKIGTYTLAVLAKEHGIPFYVAAPFSTIDLATPDGSKIPIEQRDAKEVTHIGGRQMVPTGVEVENPGFDVTPANYITAIVTERGIARAPYGESLRRLAPETAVGRQIG